MGCGRARGEIYVHIADRVLGGADGAYNRLLSRTVTAAGCRVCIEGVLDPLADEVLAAVDAVQVDLMQDVSAVSGPAAACQAPP